MLNEQTIAVLNSMKLFGMAQSLPQRLADPKQAELSHAEFSALLTQDEKMHRDNRRLARLLKNAKLKQQADAERVSDEWRTSVIKIEKEQAVANADLERLGDMLDHMDDNENCPTCGSKLTRSTIEKVKAERVAAEETCMMLEHALREALKPHEAAREAVTEARNRADKALSALQTASDATRSVRLALGANSQSLDKLDDQVDELDKEENPYAKQLAGSVQDRATVRTQHAAVLRDLGESAEHAALLGFWVRGFKDVRLVLIAEALDQLALEVASSLSALGLAGWGLSFEVDRVTKSGSVSRGFNVFVQGPGNDRQVPWESWSGGEAQRLRIAAQCGLANLIRSSTGASIALEVWDEPSAGVEAAGIADLLEALRTRAEAEKRQIWVVDHHALGSAAFDGTVLVKKGRKGTEYEVMQ